MPKRGYRSRKSATSPRSSSGIPAARATSAWPSSSAGRFSTRS